MNQKQPNKAATRAAYHAAALKYGGTVELERLNMAEADFYRLMEEFAAAWRLRLDLELKKERQRGVNVIGLLVESNGGRLAINPLVAATRGDRLEVRMEQNPATRETIYTTLVFARPPSLLVPRP